VDVPPPRPSPPAWTHWPRTFPACRSQRPRRQKPLPSDTPTDDDTAFGRRILREIRRPIASRPPTQVPDLTSCAHIKLNKRLVLPCRSSRIRCSSRTQLGSLVTRRWLGLPTDAMRDILSHDERMLADAFRELLQLRERVRKAERTEKPVKSDARKPSKRRRQRR